MILCLLVGYFAIVNQLLHHRVINRQLLDFATPHHIGTTISDVRDMNFLLYDGQQNNSRAHAAKFWFFLRLIKDLKVGFVYSLL